MLEAEAYGVQPLPLEPEPLPSPELAPRPKPIPVEKLPADLELDQEPRQVAELRAKFPS